MESTCFRVAVTVMSDKPDDFLSKSGIQFKWKRFIITQLQI